MTSEAQPNRLKCPNCGSFLGTTDAAYAEFPPCKCGFQTTIRRPARLQPRFMAAVEVKKATA